MILEIKRAFLSWRVWAIAIIGFFALGFGLFYYAKTVYGIGAFGGRITAIRYCICSANLEVTVGPPSGGVFIYQPGASMLYAYYQIFRPGAWVLGSYSPGGSCVQLIPGTPPWCLPYPAMGTITQAGTSL